MRIPEIKEYLKTVEPVRSVLLLGAPGIGKSVMIREFAEEEAESLGLQFVDYDDRIFEEVMQNPERYYVFVDLRLTEVEPSDLIGIPRDADGYVAYKPLKFAMALSSVNRGMLFLDELTNVTRLDVKAAAYKIILDRKIGFIKLSKGVRVIAAGNAPEHSSIAERLPAPLASRFHIITCDPPKVEEWITWMSEHYEDWDKRVAAYLMRFRDDFIVTPREPETLENYPTPRTWTWLSLELPKTPAKYLREKAVGYLGAEAASRFIAFINNPIPEPEELIRNPMIFYDLTLDAKYVATVMVASHFDQNKKMPAQDILRFTDVISEVQHEFAILFLLSLKDRRKQFFNAVVNKPDSSTWKALRDVASYIALIK